MAEAMETKLEKSATAGIPVGMGVGQWVLGQVDVCEEVKEGDSK